MPIPPEEAKKVLDGTVVPNWKLARNAGALLLPQQAYAVYKATQENYFAYSHNDKSHQIAHQMDLLGEKKRLALFNLLAPTLGHWLELAWQRSKGSPYQIGYERKPFRAPNSPEVTGPARLGLFTSMEWFFQDRKQPLSWYAVWAPYMQSYRLRSLGRLLAYAIDDGGPEGEEIYSILKAIVLGKHREGAMGEHVICALLSCSKPEAWKLVEDLLIHAQRQEGLRQSILETVDESHPQAFKGVLRVIVEHDLARFSSVYRAVLVWGVPAGQNMKEFNRNLARILELFDDPSDREKAVREGDVNEVWLAIWTECFHDVVPGLRLAEIAYSRPDAEVRLRAIRCASAAGLTLALPLLQRGLKDSDIKVVSASVEGLNGFNREQLQLPNLFEDLRQAADRLPVKMEEGFHGRSLAIGELIEMASDQQLMSLTPVVSEASPDARVKFLERCQESKVAGLRPLMLRFISDPSQSVREAAFSFLRKSQLAEQEAPEIEAVLGRKSSDLRVSAMKLLRTLPKNSLLSSAKRLATAPDEPKRVAGLELLADHHQSGEDQAEIEETLKAYQDDRKTLSDNERTQIERVLAPRDSESLKAITAFGLADFSKVPAPQKPRDCPGPFATNASIKCIYELDALIYEHREEKFTYENYWGAPEQVVLGEAEGFFPRPKPGTSIENQWENLPIGDVWLEWLASRAPDTRDSDGLELVRALGTIWTLTDLFAWDYGARKYRLGTAADGVEKVVQAKRVKDVKHPNALLPLLQWLVAKENVDGATLSLDAWQSLIALSYERKYKFEDPEICPKEFSWRTYDGMDEWLLTAKFLREQLPEFWKPDHDTRLYRLARFVDEPEFSGDGKAKVPKTLFGIAVPFGKLDVVLPRKTPEPDDLVRAYVAGGVSDEEALYMLLSERTSYRGSNFAATLATVTQKRERLKMPKSEKFDALLQRLIDRLIAVTVTRGDLPTEACPFSVALKSGISLNHLASVVHAAKGITWNRAGYADSMSRSGVLSSLVRHSRALEEDTPERFASLLGKLTSKQVIELAMFAPQWAKHAEHTTGWEGLEDAIWWMHAHTKDDQWNVDQDLKLEWEGQITERTPLDSESLMNGAVDTAWFFRFRAAFDEKRWKVIDAAAKLASSGAGHKRAQRFADAMLGRVTLEELGKAIKEKRHQDSVRAYGLVPVRDDADLLARYRFLQEFLRESRQFGSMKQASEKLAVAIAMENLARTAGYPDPVRLQWAMEAKEIEDLMGGSLTIQSGDLSVTLNILPTGEPEITAERAGKPIKEVPAKDKKDLAVKNLFERRKEVQGQARRMRWSLESAMIRGDSFSGKDIRELMKHPVLSPMLKTLIFVGEDGRFGWPSESGDLVDSADRPLELDDSVQKRLAHPFDFLDQGRWQEWQHAIFAKAVVQPFKQVFRELYIPSEIELENRYQSDRYRGHQLKPRQTVGILGKRGWVIGGEEGVRKVMHEHGLVAHLRFEEYFYTPAEVEGLTVQSLFFTRIGERKFLDITEIPPRVFSETMRDLDLIVSVAHMGGYDPESSQSSIEMRASVVRETMRLTRKENVSIDLPRAIVQGSLGEYSIHLGSGNIHRRPGGEIVVVPVHSQHRGRMFLPFVDDDPKTAEIVSKVLLFAEDDQIKDPSIMRQILV